MTTVADMVRGRWIAAARRVTLALVLGALLVPGIGGMRAAYAYDGPESVADLAEKLLDAVVNISTAQTVSGGQRIPMPQVPPGSPFEEFFDEFFNNRNGGDKAPSQRKVNSLGSGFVIDPSGIIITNNHVIADADEITANFNDGTKLSAEVIGRDAKTDIAVLKVKPDKPLTSVEFGDSGVLRVGDWVMAIGNPFGLGGTVTVGIVSAVNRDIGSGPYDSFIQTDAAINRGNSGGPLFNKNGQVVGINTAIISPSGGSIGIGFSVPSNMAKTVVAQLREFGETRRGWLGVRIQSVTDEIAESLGMDTAAGALVAGVNDDGPAKSAGIEPGDVILKFAGKAIPEMRDLPRIVAETAIGDTVDVVILRKGDEKTIKVTVGRLPEDTEKVANAPAEIIPEPEETQTALGLDLSSMTDELRGEYDISEDVSGVVITGVEDGSPAAEKRIAAGEVIVEVAQEEVSAPADVVKRIDELKKQSRKSVLLLLANPQGELRFVALRIEGD